MCNRIIIRVYLLWGEPGYQCVLKRHMETLDCLFWKQRRIINTLLCRWMWHGVTTSVTGCRGWGKRRRMTSDMTTDPPEGRGHKAELTQRTVAERIVVWATPKKPRQRRLESAEGHWLRYQFSITQGEYLESSVVLHQHSGSRIPPEGLEEALHFHHQTTQWYLYV